MQWQQYTVGNCQHALLTWSDSHRWSLAFRSQPDKHSFYPSSACFFLWKVLRLQSFSKCQDEFRSCFLEFKVLRKPTTGLLVSCFWETGSVDDHKCLNPMSVFPNESLGTVHHLFMHSPQESIWKVTQQTEISHSSVQKATKRLNPYPIQINTVWAARTWQGEKTPVLVMVSVLFTMVFKCWIRFGFLMLVFKWVHKMVRITGSGVLKTSIFFLRDHYVTWKLESGVLFCRNK